MLNFKKHHAFVILSVAKNLIVILRYFALAQYDGVWGVNLNKKERTKNGLCK